MFLSMSFFQALWEIFTEAPLVYLWSILLSLIILFFIVHKIIGAKRWINFMKKYAREDFYKKLKKNHKQKRAVRRLVSAGDEKFALSCILSKKNSDIEIKKTSTNEMQKINSNGRYYSEDIFKEFI